VVLGIVFLREKTTMHVHNVFFFIGDIPKKKV